MKGFVWLSKILNPFKPTKKDRSRIPAGMSLAGIKEQYIGEASIRMWVNGQPVHDMALVPSPGSEVTVMPLVADDGGKEIFRSLLLLGVGVLAWWASPFTAAWATAAFAAGATMGAGLLLNTLMPPQLPKVGEGGAKNSQYYAWQPQNTTEQGEPMQMVYGEARIYPNIIGAYIEHVGSDEYLNILAHCGLGPVKRIYGVKLNDQPVKNFKNVEVRTRVGHLRQPVIKNWAATKIEYIGYQPAEYNQPVTRQTSVGPFDKLEIDVSCPEGLSYTSAEGIQETSVDFRIRVRQRPDGGTWGDWATLSTSHDDYSAARRAGCWSRGKYGQVDGDIEEEWIEYEEGATDTEAHYEGESGADDTFWRWIDQLSDTGAGGETVYVPAGQRDYFTLKGRRTRPFTKTYGTTRPHSYPGQYEIELTRLTEDHGIKTRDEIQLGNIREVVWARYTYPRQALISVRAKATNQLSGSIRLSCLVKGRLVNRFDGLAWSIGWSDSPAWVSHDIATLPVIDGTGTTSDPYRLWEKDGKPRYDAYDAVMIDHDMLLEWGEWCQESVPDGRGGTEPRFTFNGSFDYASNVWDALLKAAQAARAVPFWNGLWLTWHVSRPRESEGLFTVGNIDEEGFDEYFLPREERATEITVDYQDRDDDYQKKPVTIYTRESDGTYQSSLQFEGVVKESEVWRLASFKLACNEELEECFSFQADVDAIGHTLGDVIDLQHDVLETGTGGYLLGATEDVVMLEKYVEIEAGKLYQIYIRLRDDTRVTRNVVNEPGAHQYLELDPPLPQVPSKYDIYAFGEVGRVVEQVQILDFEILDDFRCRIDTIQYKDSCFKYDNVPPKLNARPATYQAACDALKLNHAGSLNEVNGIYTAKINATWVNPVDGTFSHTEVWCRSGDGRWRLAATSDTGSVDFEVEPGSDYDVALVAVSTTGEKTALLKAPRRTIQVPAANSATAIGFLDGQSLEEWKQTLALVIPAQDHTFVGPSITRSIDSGQTVVFGSVLYVAADGELELADANTEASALCMCMATGSCVGEQTVILSGCIVRNDTWTWDMEGDKRLWVSTTAGELTQTQPSTDKFGHVVGVVISEKTIIFAPTKVVVHNSAYGGNWALVDSRSFSNEPIDYTISGINGDTNIDWMVRVDAIGDSNTTWTTNHLVIRPNGDDTVSNYTNPRQYGGSLHGGDNPYSASGMILAYNSNSNVSFSETIIHTKAYGKYRMAIQQMANLEGSTDRKYSYSTAPMWKNTSDTITSLQIKAIGPDMTMADIRVYKWIT